MVRLKAIFIILIAILLTGCGPTPTISYASSSISIEVGSYYTIDSNDICINNYYEEVFTKLT